MRVSVFCQRILSGHLHAGYVRRASSPRRFYLTENHRRVSSICIVTAAIHRPGFCSCNLVSSPVAGLAARASTRRRPRDQVQRRVSRVFTASFLLLSFSPFRPSLVFSVFPNISSRYIPLDRFISMLFPVEIARNDRTVTIRFFAIFETVHRAEGRQIIGTRFNVRVVKSELFQPHRRDTTKFVQCCIRNGRTLRSKRN